MRFVSKTKACQNFSLAVDGTVDGNDVGFLDSKRYDNHPAMDRLYICIYIFTDGASGGRTQRPGHGHGHGNEQGQTTGNKQFHLPTAVSK